MEETSYHTTVRWSGGHTGHLVLGNGPQMDFSAPPDAYGMAGVFTPEDGFVAAVNTCIMLMFLWAVERLKLTLVSYECRAEATKRVELDRTESFSQFRLTPFVCIHAGDETTAVVESRARRALQMAQKYSLVANSIKSAVKIEPIIEVIP